MLIPNQQVTFRNPENGNTITANVQVYAATRDAHLYPDAEDYTWAIAWPSALVYGDGTAVWGGHEILWEQLGVMSDGSFRGATLSKPRKSFLIPRSTAYIKEVD